MIIYNPDGTELVTITPKDTSYRYRTIMEIDSLTLYFDSVDYIEVPIGAYCQFQTETYTLYDPQNFKKHGTRNFEYTLILEGDWATAERYKVRNIVDKRLKFDYTVKPIDHLRLIVNNMNLRDDGWVVGDCIDAPEKLISYNHIYCKDALQTIADEFETEWQVVGKTIHLRRIEYNKDNPLALSYGRGNGFKTGLGRANYDDSKPVEILYVQGGERNIDYSTYASKSLLLPKNQHFEYEGRTYESDADGLSIKRADKPVVYNNEDSLDLSHIYPSRVGTVSSVEVIDADNHFYDFLDNSIPADLDFSQQRIAGETITIVFQSGLLAGKEFEIEQNEDSVTGYVHAERRFKLVPQEIDGITMPNDVWLPSIGDKYAVFGISMPDAYVSDNVNETGASWDMFKEAARYLYENEDHKFSFTGELDGIYAKQNWLEIGGKIKVGGYIDFSDTQFQPDGVLIRITGIKDFLNNPYSPSIELSNQAFGGSLGSELKKIDATEVVIDGLRREASLYTKRRWRDLKETQTLLETAFDHFSGAINPISVQTMQLIAGDESLQFRFVDDEITPETVSHHVTFDGETKVLNSPAGIIQHMTLGISSLSSVRNVADYFFWNMSEYNSPPLADPEQPYYLYARCSKSNDAGTFLLSADAIAVEEEAGYYHFLVGVLNSQNEDGDRSYVDLYGYTEILPGRITVNKIVSPSGQMYIDMEANGGIGEIGGIIKFRSAVGTYKDVDDLNYADVGADYAGAASAAEADAKSFADQLFDDMDSLKQDAVVNGQTLIAGGYLRNDFIQTSTLLISSANVTDLGALALLNSLDHNDVGADAAGAAQSVFDDLNQDKLDAVINGQTLILNGYLNTDFIEAGTIQANKLVSTDITALGDITAGTFNLGSGNFLVDANGYLTATGGTFKSSSGSKRIEITSSSNEMTFYESGAAKIRIGSSVYGSEPGIAFESGSRLSLKAGSRLVASDSTWGVGQMQGALLLNFWHVVRSGASSAPNGAFYVDAAGNLGWKDQSGNQHFVAG